MTVRVLTPQLATDAVELSGGRWKKQILPMRPITYTGRDGKKRVIDFNRAYLTDLVTAYNDKAYDQVPFQIADAANTHTNDPARTAGEFVQLELGNDGLYAVLEPNEFGKDILAKNPKLSVSARIFENMDRSDGKHYPRALQHVLGTLDPQVPGLKPWEQVAEDAPVGLSGGTEDFVDLSNANYEEKKMPENAAGSVTMTLSADQNERLQNLLNDDEAASAALAGATAELANQSGTGAPTLAELANQGTAGGGAEGGTPVTVADPAVLEFVRTQTELANTRVMELSAQLAQAQTAGEIDRLSQTGLAPAIIEAARPLLQLQPAAVELSNGTENVDPGAVIREVLDTVVALSRAGLDVINLGTESGSGIESDPKSTDRAAMLTQWSESYGN